MSILSTLWGKGKKAALQCEWAISLDSQITSQLTSGFLDEESIVAGTADGKIYAIGSSGKIKWSYSITKSIKKEEAFFMENENITRVKSTPIISDINNNGKGEVIFGSEMGTLYALTHKGQIFWTFEAKDAISGSVIAEDINNDGNVEILFGSSDGVFYALKNTGKLLWSFKAGSGIESQPAVLKGASKQIIFGSNDGTVYSLNEKGKKLWDFKTNGKVTAQPSIGNLYNDGRTFIVLGSLDNNLYALTDEGTLLWSYATEGKIFSRAAFADLDNDHRHEIVFGSCDDKLHILSAAGKKIWDYETNFWVVDSPLVDDFDADKRLEIAIGSFDSFVYILEAEGNYTIDYMPGISAITGQSGHYTELAISEPGSYSGKLLSQFKTDGMIMGLALMGKKEIIAASDVGKIYKLSYKIN